MSNKDVLAALREYGVDSNDNTQSKTKKKNPSELVYGPKGVISNEPEPNLSSPEDGNAVYPHIYGPDIPLVPGKKVQTQDSSEEGGDYDYNVDLGRAFPKADGPPQPFLTNFSSFQR